MSGSERLRRSPARRMARLHTDCGLGAACANPTDACGPPHYRAMLIMKRLSMVAVLVVLITAGHISPSLGEDDQAKADGIIRPHVDRCRADLQWCATKKEQNYVKWYSDEISNLIASLKDYKGDCNGKLWTNVASGISRYRQYGVMVPDRVYNEIGKSLQSQPAASIDREKLRQVETVVRSAIEADKKHLELKLVFADAARKAECYDISEGNYKDVIAFANGRADLAATLRRAQAGLDDVVVAKR